MPAPYSLEPPAVPFDPKASPPDPASLEWVACYGCGGSQRTPFRSAQDDLGGKPGTFTFVTCSTCGLVYQCPRIPLERIAAYYDDEYVSHRHRVDWGPFTRLYERAMSSHDRKKVEIARRHVALGPSAEVLDVGCGAGTFLHRVHEETGARVTGVDFKDLRHLPWYEAIDARLGLFYEQALGKDRFDLITMWHFLEHDYDPRRSLAHARDLLRPGSGRLVIEVPRLDSTSARLFRGRWPGLQAPQHTVLFDKEQLLRFVREADLEVVEHLPYGAFPAYFYLFTGAAFLFLRGRGLDLRKAVGPYFLGRALLAPLLLLERRLNLAMQTVVCKRR